MNMHVFKIALIKEIAVCSLATLSECTFFYYFDHRKSVIERLFTEHLLKTLIYRTDNVNLSPTVDQVIHLNRLYT